MISYQEAIDQAVTNVQMLGTHGTWTNIEKLYAVTKAVHRYQSATNVVRRQLSIATSSLDSEGSVAIDADIQKIIRGELYVTGSTDPILVSVVPDDYFVNIKQGNLTWPRVMVAGESTSRYMMARMRERFFFYPFSGLSGTVKVHYIPKLQPYSIARGALSTGDYADANTNLAEWMEDNSPPAELDSAEEAIIAFTSAQLLRSIKGWRKAFAHDYQEWMAEYQSMVDDVISDHHYNNMATSAPSDGGPGS